MQYVREHCQPQLFNSTKVNLGIHVRIDNYEIEIKIKIQKMKNIFGKTYELQTKLEILK